MEKSALLIILLNFTIFFFPYSTQGTEQKKLPPIYLNKVDRSRLPYCLEKIKLLPLQSCNAEDLDGDGTDELIIVNNQYDKSIYPNSIIVDAIETERARFQSDFDGLIRAGHSLPIDLDEDGAREIIISELKSDTVFLHILDLNGNILFSIAGAIKPENIKRRWDCVIVPEAVMDINGDGHKEILYIVQTGLAYQPRGIYAMDIYNKKVIWDYRTGFQPQSLHLLDINGDGKREILFGSNAPDNCEAEFGKDFLVNGTDDKHTYLTVLDSIGNCLKSYKVGGKYSRVYLFMHDLNGDWKPEAIVNFISRGHQKEANFIALWDPQTGNLGPRIELGKDSYEILIFLDADRNGKDDLLVCWGDGTIEFRDHRLEIILSRQFPGLSPSSLISEDLNNDGEEEIIISGDFKGRCVNIIIDRKLNLLAFKDSNLKISIPAVNPGFGKDKLLLASPYAETRGGVLLLKMKKQDILLPAIPWQWLGFGSLGGMILVGVVLLVIFRNRLHKCRTFMLKSAVNADRIPSIILDHDGIIIIVNREMERFLDINQEEVTGKPYENIFLDSKWHSIVDIIKSSFKNDKVSLQQELSVVQNSEHMDILIFVNSIPLDQSGEIGRMIRIQDITDLSQSKRTVAWAVMAQRLAHEVKTPLSTVMLSAQRLQMECENWADKTDMVDKYIQRILGQVKRLRKMTDAFMKFSRIEKPGFERVDINRLISEWLKENRFKFGSDIKLEEFLADDLPKVSGDTQQLSIVLQNLIENSLDAMMGKGVLTISTRLVQSLHTDSIGLTGNSVEMEITDTGKGMTKNDLNQLFKPFFSKSPGGTGLGLVISKKIIEDHKGAIRVESEVDVGTTVFVTLPVDR